MIGPGENVAFADPTQASVPATRSFSFAALVRISTPAAASEASAPLAVGAHPAQFFGRDDESYVGSTARAFPQCDGNFGGAERFRLDVDPVARCLRDRLRLEPYGRTFVEGERRRNDSCRNVAVQDVPHRVGDGPTVRRYKCVAFARRPITVVEVRTTVNDGCFHVHRLIRHIRQPDRRAARAQFARNGGIRASKFVLALCFLKRAPFEKDVDRSTVLGGIFERANDRRSFMQHVG